MGNFGDSVSLLTDYLSTARISHFLGACDALEIFRDYEDMLTLLEYVRDNKEGKFPAASRQALSNKIAFYTQFQAADNE
jgi:hypothetical protein